MSINKSRWFDKLQVLLWFSKQERLLFKASHTRGVLTENHFKSGEHPKVKSRAAANKSHLLFQNDGLKALYNNVFPCHRVDRYYINRRRTTTLKRFDFHAANPHIGDALITILPFFSLNKSTDYFSNTVMCTMMNQPKRDMEGSLCGFSKHASLPTK